MNYAPNVVLHCPTGYRWGSIFLFSGFLRVT